jgi:hypothetical protein
VKRCEEKRRGRLSHIKGAATLIRAKSVSADEDDGASCGKCVFCCATVIRYAELGAQRQLVFGDGEFPVPKARAAAE